MPLPVLRGSQSGVVRRRPTSSHARARSDARLGRGSLRREVGNSKLRAGSASPSLQSQVSTRPETMGAHFCIGRVGCDEAAGLDPRGRQPFGAGETQRCGRHRDSLMRPDIRLITPVNDSAPFVRCDELSRWPLAPVLCGPTHSRFARSLSGAGERPFELLMFVEVLYPLVCRYVR
jgi:hypothetical protein